MPDLPRSTHISTSLASLHWLQAAERVKFKLATLTQRCLHGTAARYLIADFSQVANLPYRRHICSGSSDALLVRPTRLVTVGDCAFPVAAAKL